FVRPLNYPGVLAELVRELPHDLPLRAAKIHTATDGQLVIDTFEFGQGEPFDPHDPDQALKLEQTMGYAALNLPQWSADRVRDYFHRCTADYVLTVTPLRMCSHWQLYTQVTGTDGTAVWLEPESDPTQSRIVVAAGNVTTRSMLERVATRLSRSSINVHRAYLDVISDSKNGSISLLGFVVHGPGGKAIDPDSPLWHSVRGDLLRIKWMDERTLNLAYRHPDLSMTRAEIITGLGDLIHQCLVKTNPYAYNPDRIATLCERNLARVTSITDLFLERFDPANPLGDQEFATRSTALVKEFDSAVDGEDARTVLKKMLEAVHAVLRTNVYVEHRWGLAMRIHPALLANEDRTELPFGAFFVHGRAFNGFHVRFRDIARGGVRAIRTVGADQYAREAERLYDEAYYLAFAQQLKNKDIPEGGAKAVILLAPDAQLERSVKGFVDCLLDLITPDPSVRKHIVDRFGQEELLYLGPDENITPQLIEWIVDRAKRRGYPTPTALMSSKPGAGINHKQYGVTSEGVNVFLDVALRAVGIDPKKQVFTVKLTGGPDGDVAGNIIKIMYRDYGANAKIVGIADGSGCGEDPNGLDHSELLRLAKAELPISFFERSKLGPRGRIVTLQEPNGVQLRNTLHNRIIADAFLPCGGRPNAINAKNWKEYLQPNGAPTSKVIVEGANLFLNPEARAQLSDCGVLIFKDSSANKCGVICSSFEIGASMLLSEEEFLRIKDRFVQQVLVKLRELARREAELLARIRLHRPQVALPEVSTRISRVMIRTADAIEGSIDRLSPDDAKLMQRLVIDHLPAVLLETVRERLWTKMPRPYLKWIMAKSLAARMVYREGFEYLETMPPAAIADLGVRYLRSELERTQLVEELAKSNLPDRQRIAELLGEAGILTTLE
ncbi:MAG: NAD-glutamate dehydrogenase, partial [Phycisphaerales bacterium]|nr:NAD-glutamate dehydrogenase [Phycisphaerales bacterium]